MRRPKSPDELPAMPLWRRVLIFMLAVATAATIVWLLLNRPGDPKRDMPRVVREPAPCATGQARDCVGGKVIVVPASQASAASR
jgi:hypothetical protein